jgi:DNA-binding NarL/FixJ family response regulator
LKNKMPYKVALMDDDFYALKWNTALFMRDPRTTIVIDAGSPSELLSTLDIEKVSPDAFLIDVEYKDEQISLLDLLLKLRENHPNSSIVCLSQYGEPEQIHQAIKAGANGFLLKNEVKMAIVPALIKSISSPFLYTPSIGEKIDDMRNVETELFPAWLPNPKLTPQIMKAFWLRVFFGMRAAFAAEELFVAKGTVERYINQAYRILPDMWGDDSYMDDIDLDSLSPEDQAFVWFTLPPRKNNN